MSRFEWLEFDDQAKAPAAYAAVQQTPTDGPSFYLAARRMRESGFFDAAATFYERAIGFNDQDYAARVELADTLIRAKRIEEADRASYDALNNYRQVRLFYASRALALAHRGSLDEAFPLSDISMEGNAPWYARCVRAELLLKQSLDHRSEALSLLQEAVSVADFLWEVHFVGGMILLSAGWAVLAAGFFGEAVHCNPRGVAGLLYLGDCFKALRLYEQAQFYYQKAQEVEPKHELALQRQKECAPAIFGLTRVFHRESLGKRWNKEYEKLVQKGASNGNPY